LNSLILRVAGGLLMLILHGWGKYQAYGDRAAKFPDPLGVSPEISMALTIFAEVGCAALLVVGLCTRWAAGVSAFTMFIAACVIHGDDPLAKQEKALLFLAIYSSIAVVGAGRFSLDHLIYRK
jgi:putative oxidoreductase